jgi:hypothetical protein
MHDQDFDRNARQLLMRRILEGSPTGVNYAPDSHYDAAKRCNVQGPLTLQIAQILARHSKLWAAGMRERGQTTAEDSRVAWLLEMREADAEITRFLAGHTIGHGAAA